MIIFNFIGLGMLALGFGIAYGLGLVLGFTSEAMLMVISGPLLLVCDLGYRMRKRVAGPEWSVAAKAEQAQWWFHPKLGGQLFFAPIWMWAIVWMAIGLYRLLA